MQNLSKSNVNKKSKIFTNDDKLEANVKPDNFRAGTDVKEIMGDIKFEIKSQITKKKRRGRKKKKMKNLYTVVQNSVIKST